MLNVTRTKIIITTQRNIATANAATIKEGMALVAQMAAGTGTVAPSGGQTYEPFVGVALGPIRNDTVGVMSQQLIPSSTQNTVPLIRQSVSGTVGIIRDDGTMLAMTVSTAGSQPSNPSAGNVIIWTPTGATFDTVIFAPADVTAALALGYNWTALYRYIYLPIDIQSIVGSNLSPGVVPEAWINEVPVLQYGDAATDCYATDENWYGTSEDTGALAGMYKVVAGGLFAPWNSSKAGVVPGSGYIIQPPTTSDPWLIIGIR